MRLGRFFRNLWVMPEQRKREIPFRFDREKSIAMMQYFIAELGGRTPYIPVVKLAFFADRLHVRQHARPISFDSYYAFKNGPGGSNLMNLVNKENAMAARSWGIDHPTEYEVILLPGTIPNKKKFSISDLEAIHFALEHFGKLARHDRFALPNLTHAYPEWAQHKLRFMLGGKRFDLSYEDFLVNADKGKKEFRIFGMTDPFPELSAEEAEEIAEEMQEYSSILHAS